VFDGGARLINTAARSARSANRLVLHLPCNWSWEPCLSQRFRAALHEPYLPRLTTGPTGHYRRSPMEKPDIPEAYSQATKK